MIIFIFIKIFFDFFIISKKKDKISINSNNHKNNNDFSSEEPHNKAQNNREKIKSIESIIKPKKAKNNTLNYSFIQ